MQRALLHSAGCTAHKVLAAPLARQASGAAQAGRQRRQLSVRHRGVAPTCSSSGRSSGWLDVGTTPIPSEYDAVLVLGGGLTPDGGLPPWVTRRLDGALHIYQRQRRPCPVVLLGAGTPHKPPVIGDGGFVLHESTAYAKYLMDQGVPAAHLLKEVQSYDTVGNAYFSLTIHAVPAGWRRLAVVTSDFHMPRTAATFDFVYRLAGAQGLGGPYTLSYHAVSDEGLFDAAVLEARVEKEAAATETWRRNSAALASVADLHAWLFSTHLCYSVSRQAEFGKERDIDPRLAATY